MTRAPNVKPPPTMRAATLILSGDERKAWGCTVTAHEQESGERIVLYRAGRGALAAICSTLDALEGDWRVASFSTPETIYRDLQGTRYREWGDEMQYPEVAALGHIGRLDLLDPALEPHMRRGATHS